MTKGIIRIDLVPENYPDRKLDDDEMEVTKKLIRCILGFPKGTLVPKFTDT